MKNVAKYIIGVVGFLASFFAVVALFSAKMPVYVFATDCSMAFDEEGKSFDEINIPHYSSLSEKIISFVEFGEQHTAEIVYIDIQIEASDHAGRCNMNLDHLDLPPSVTENMDVTYGIRVINKDNNGELRDFELPKSLWARTAGYNGGSVSIFMPSESSIKTNGLYTIQKDWYYYSVSGPFVLQYHSGNGYNGVSFEPIEQSESFWQEVGCVKRRLEYPRFIRNFIPCM